MIKICFICLGNICRSPMAEFIMKDKIKKLNLEDKYHIESRATSYEEEGNVTRQTIFNWELDETAPNPEQLKLLSKALQVSIDILVDNDIVANNSNKTIYNIAKFIGIIFLILLVIDIITFIIFMF